MLSVCLSKYFPSNIKHRYAGLRIWLYKILERYEVMNIYDSFICIYCDIVMINKLYIDIGKNPPSSHQYSKKTHLKMHHTFIIVIYCSKIADEAEAKAMIFMMTSSNRFIFSVTGPFCGEFPSQRPVTRSFDVFFDLWLNKRMSLQARRRWFETASCSLLLHKICNGHIKSKCNTSCAYFMEYKTCKISLHKSCERHGVSNQRQFDF